MLLSQILWPFSSGLLLVHKISRSLSSGLIPCSKIPWSLSSVLPLFLKFCSFFREVCSLVWNSLVPLPRTGLLPFGGSRLGDFSHFLCFLFCVSPLLPSPALLFLNSPFLSVPLLALPVLSVAPRFFSLPLPCPLPAFFSLPYPLPFLPLALCLSVSRQNFKDKCYAATAHTHTTANAATQFHQRLEGRCPSREAAK